MGLGAFGNCFDRKSQTSNCLSVVRWVVLETREYGEGYEEEVIGIHRRSSAKGDEHEHHQSTSTHVHPRPQEDASPCPHTQKGSLWDIILQISLESNVDLLAASTRSECKKGPRNT